MKKTFVVSALAVTLLAGGAWSLASAQAQSPDRPAGAHGMGGMQMGGGDMMGMMDMMGNCSRMMQGGMAGHMLPQLPPGNEKLQLQMQAEMMQKMGEIVSKYAAQIKDEKK
ncbi:MAG: hypothetical protein KDH15_21330 [Rhodocyclaceae bacterium]|nr:hypothetical protein [Rhodocyclaceae bacterium]